MMVWRGGLPGVSPGFLVVWLSGDHFISTVGLPCKYACRDALAGGSLMQEKMTRAASGREEKEKETERSRQQSYVSGRMADGWTCVGRESHGSWG